MSKAPPLHAAYINKKAGKVFPFLPILIKMNGNNKDGKPLNIQTEFAVLGKKKEFPNESILDETGTIHSVLSLSTFFTKQEVYGHFESILDHAKEKGTILLEIHDTIKDKTREHRQEVINHLSLKDLETVERAVKLYIGNFFFWKMVDIWDMLMHDIQTSIDATVGESDTSTTISPQDQIKASVNKYKPAFKEDKMMKELLEGKPYNRHIIERGAYGGIESFINFIKDNDSNAHDEIQNYIKWAMKEATKQLRMTPERNLRLYHYGIEGQKEFMIEAGLETKDGKDYP